MAILSGKEVIEMCIEIERNGAAFYEGLAKEVKDEGLAKVFTMLSRSEVLHISAFERLSESGKSEVELPKDKIDYLKKLAASSIFKKTGDRATALRTAMSKSEVIKVAIEIEKDALLFFYEILNSNIIRERDEPVLRDIIEQEKQHIKELLVAKD